MGFTIFQSKFTGFTFKEKTLNKGHYIFPFSFRLPVDIPGSFRWVDARGEKMAIRYSMKVFMGEMKEHLKVEREIMVHEFLFTKEEIDKDWEIYNQMIQARLLLKQHRSLPKELKPKGVEADYSDHAMLTSQFNKLHSSLFISQSINIDNKNWNNEFTVQQKKCCCFKSSYLFKIQSSINKHFFFPDDKVVIKIQTDNTSSTQDIESITCSLMQRISIRKNNKDMLQKIEYELKTY